MLGFNFLCFNTSWYHISSFMYMRVSSFPKLVLCARLSNNDADDQYLGSVPANKMIVGSELCVEEKSYYSIFISHFKLNVLYPITSMWNGDWSPKRVSCYLLQPTLPAVPYMKFRNGGEIKAYVSDDTLCLGSESFPAFTFGCGYNFNKLERDPSIGISCFG